jgi:hypothetical protein
MTCPSSFTSKKPAPHPSILYSARAASIDQPPDVASAADAAAVAPFAGAADPVGASVTRVVVAMRRK